MLSQCSLKFYSEVTAAIIHFCKPLEKLQCQAMFLDLSSVYRILHFAKVTVMRDLCLAKIHLLKQVQSLWVKKASVKSNMNVFLLITIFSHRFPGEYISFPL